MRKPLIRILAPFLAVALLPALIILFAPDDGDGSNVATAPVAGDTGATGDEAALPEGAPAPADPSATGSEVAPTGGGGGAGGTGGGAPPAGGGGGGGGGSGAARPGGGAATGAPAGAAKGDTSHCREGRQQSVTFYGPPCIAKFAGNNGGGTHQGVTDKEIKVVVFREKPNEQVNAFLRGVGLANSTEEFSAFIDAATEFLNKRYELYGRKIKIVKILEADCPQTPPDVPKCREAAKAVIAQKPFAVIWNTSLYSTVFDEFARAGIVALGGWNMDSSSFTTRRPFRWDILMDGTRVGQAVADYYCKKLAGKPASHSGATIHPTIGLRGQVQRKVGIISPEDPSNLATANNLARLIAKCDGGRLPPVFGYESNIARAQEQTTATTAGLIQAKVTTIVHMGDPIALIFRTRGSTSQGYFPEYLMSGTQFVDYDIIGRLYDPQQWVHAFGPSQLTNPLPFDQQDHSKVWKDAGRPGQACSTCGTYWAYFSLLGSMLQSAGPQLAPPTAERGLFSIPARGGDPVHALTKFGPGDYTAADDTREVYWSPTATSAIDGRPGAYVPIDGGKRYPVGRYDGTFKIPVPSS